MFKVLPIQSKDTQKELCEKCGVTFDADLLAYAVSVDDEFAGICQFKLTDKGGEIHDLAPALTKNDPDALFVMGRGALNFIDLCGVHIAYFEDKSFTEEGMIRSIGFSQDESGRWMMDLDGFFTEPCKCSK